MIYMNWLRFAVLGSALIQSVGKLQSRAAASDRKLTFSASSGTPSDTCVSEDQCNEQRKKMGFEDKYYYDNHFPDYGCFYKNNKAYWGRGGTAAENAKDPLSGIKERIWCDGWNDDGHKPDGWNGDGHKPSKSSTRIDSYFYCGSILSLTKHVNSLSCIYFSSLFTHCQPHTGALSSFTYSDTVSYIYHLNLTLTLLSSSTSD